MIVVIALRLVNVKRGFKQCGHHVLHGGFSVAPVMPTTLALGQIGRRKRLKSR